jgi:hypothetical protein
LGDFVSKHPEYQVFYSWDCILYNCYASGLGLSPNGQWTIFFNVTKKGGGLQFDNYGQFTWSPDNMKIIFVATIGHLEERGENPVGFTVFLINLEIATISTVFKDDQRYI